jgi:hypothetical protein
VLHLGEGTDDAGRVTIGPLAFRSVHGRDLDARTLAPALVSDAARDVRGAVTSAMGG